MADWHREHDEENARLFASRSLHAHDQQLRLIYLPLE
jgi:hypothetical protein